MASLKMPPRQHVQAIYSDLKRSRGICFDFQQGGCSRAAGCHFSHGADRGDGPCYDSAFQLGSCPRGLSCRFFHDVPAHGGGGFPPRGRPAGGGGGGRGALVFISSRIGALEGGVDSRTKVEPLLTEAEVDLKDLLRPEMPGGLVCVCVQWTSSTKPATRS